MSVRNVQVRIIVSSLMAVASLFANVHADSADKTLKAHKQRQCGAASPLLLSLGDAYFDIAGNRNDAVMSPNEIEQNKLLSRLSVMHLSEGSGVRVLCTGSPDQIRAQLHIVSLEDIEGRQTLYSGNESAISITAYEYDKPSRRLVRETVTIPTRSQDVIHLAGQNLETSTRHRQATRIGSYLEETRIDASIRDNTITIDQSVYVNGTLAQWATWTLSD